MHPREFISDDEASILDTLDLPIRMMGKISHVVDTSTIAKDDEDDDNFLEVVEDNNNNAPPSQHRSLESL